MEQSTRWFYAICFSLLVYFTYILSPIITPFMLGALIAYLGNPLTSWCERKGIPRALGVVFVFIIVVLFVILLLFLIVPILEQQLAILIQHIPLAIDWLQENVIPWVNKHIDKNQINLLSLKKQLSANLPKVGQIATHALEFATESTHRIILIITNIVMVPVVAFYLMRDWDEVMLTLKKMLPKNMQKKAIKIAKECDEIIGAFLKGQLAVMLGLAVVYSFGLWLIDLQVAIAIGVLSGVAAVVPYLGFILGIFLASVASLIEYHTLLHLILVWAVYGAGQFIESFILTPWFVGDRIGLHPVAVIFALLAGGYLFGFLGVLLALPAAAVILVFMRNMHAIYVTKAEA
ncbi:MAG: AI-2E family transporter [Gammaproteobacteria bacterium]